MKSIGKYRLIAELGTGGMATVYLAVMRGHGGFNKLVVLKIPRDEVKNDPNSLAMFLDEARIAARLSHPNVVQTFEVIHEDGRDVLVMEYLDGYSLSEVLTRARKSGTNVPALLQLRIIVEALKGLHYAHEATDFDGTPLGFVHRDVSPHNMLLTFDGQVKLLDFGIAKATMQSHKTEFGTFKGKVRYVPVEQLAGSNVDRRVDVYAVGVIVWEAVVGERMWKNRNDVEVMSAVIGGTVPAIRDVSPNASPELDAICRRALAHDREQRYATAADLQNDLERFLGAQPNAPQLRDMVEYLRASFGDRHAARRKVIDEQIRRAMAAPEFQTPSMIPESLPMLGTSGAPDASGSQKSGSTNLGTVLPTQAPPAEKKKPAWPIVVAILAFVLLGTVTTVLAVLLLKRKPVEVARVDQRGGDSVTAAVEPPPAVTKASATTETVAPPPPVTASASPPVAVATTTTARPGRTAPPPPPPPHTVAPPPSATEAAGTFSFTTYPWTKVSENGKSLGTTPLYKLPMSAGTHVLTLENPDEGVKTTYTVVIKSGEGLTRSVALK